MPPFTHKKRTRVASEPAPDEGIELQELSSSLQTLTNTHEALHSSFVATGIPNMRIAGDRRRLAEQLYSGNYMVSMQTLRENNPELVVVLTAQLTNASTETEHSELARARHVDGMLLDICRAHNKDTIPVLTAAMSLLGECNHVSREYHDALALYHRGAALSEKWVRDFMAEARTWRPPPSDASIAGVAVAVFDNLSMKVDYSSYSTQGETGYKLDMTNWLSTRVPQSLAPALDAQRECARPRSRARARARARSPELRTHPPAVFAGSCQRHLPH